MSAHGQRNRSTTNVSRRRAAALSAVLLTSVLLNLLSWISSPFSDWYTDHIFPLWEATLGRLTSLVPFSVGEILIFIGLAWLVLFAVILLVTGYHAFFKKTRRKNILGGMARATAWILALVLLIQTLNCFILYHCTPLSPGGEKTKRDYTAIELAMLRDAIVVKVNALCEEIPHDEDGLPIYDLSHADETAKEAVQRLSEDYPRFSSYCVTPKPLALSGFISQQNMQGYYFPFSMEANYNTVMMAPNIPFTMCHELAHTHGYIYEDEANYLGFLACIASDDLFFQYSGWLGVLNYVDNDFYETVGKAEYRRHVAVSKQVRLDNRFLTDEAWEKVEEKAVLDTEMVRDAADTFVDTTLKVNGVEAGSASYTYVVELLLRHYIGTSTAAEETY